MSDLCTQFASATQSSDRPMAEGLGSFEKPVNPLPEGYDILACASEARIVLLGDGNHVSGVVRQTAAQAIASINPAIVLIEGYGISSDGALNTPDIAETLAMSWDIKDPANFSTGDFLTSILSQDIKISGADLPPLIMSIVAINESMNAELQKFKGYVNTQASLISSESENVLNSVLGEEGTDFYNLGERLRKHIDKINELPQSDKETYLRIIELSEGANVFLNTANQAMGSFKVAARDEALAQSIHLAIEGNPSGRPIMLYVGASHIEGIRKILSENYGYSENEIFQMSIVPLTDKPGLEQGLVGGHPVIFVQDNTPFPKPEDFIQYINPYEDRDKDGSIGFPNSAFPLASAAGIKP